MSLERFIARYRAESQRLLDKKGVGRDGDMDEYINSVKAGGMNYILTALEEEIRQSSRVHQDRT